MLILLFFQDLEGNFFVVKSSNMPLILSSKTSHSCYFTAARRTGLVFAAALLLAGRLMAQYPVSCASVSSRANSNGGAGSCPNVSGTPYAANFAGTAYATVPGSSKTGNITLKYTGATTSLKPFAITKVWQTNPSTVLLPISFGPAGTPTVSGSDILVSYCFYGANMPSLGTLSFQFTNPETNAVFGICSFDASCNSSCAVVANPATLPVELVYFNAKPVNGSVQLSWVTGQEMNNKGFFIERSAGDSLFSTISFVPSPHAQGGSATETTYSYTDSNVPSAAVLWYRLRQADFDGR
ncbi:MAG TPA: hypothetical protein VLD19_07790, partial [Chitinophagaceae bacterium]|nr:hypothetical protein [Chitinophagaceae bacterium]